MDLSDFFITKAQAIDFQSKITAIVDGMYTNNFSIEKALTDQFGMQKKDAFLKLFRDNHINDTQRPQVQEFLKKLQDAVANLPLIELTIAFEPTEEILRSISQWFVATLSKQFLLTVRVDSHLVAGATITSRGKFKDYSFAKQFNAIVSHVLTPTSLPTQQHAESMKIGR